MLGFGPFSGDAFSEISPFVISAAGQADGLATVVGFARQLGIVAAVGTAHGIATAFAGSRSFGGPSLAGVQAFDFSVNALQALLWEYNTAPNLTALVTAKQKWYDDNYTTFWEGWVNDVFDLRTANDFGCSVWAIILQLPLAVEEDIGDGENWGFDPVGKNFDNGNFYPQTPQPLKLTVQQKRIALQLRYYQLITRGFVPDINKYMNRVFSSYGPVWVIDNYNMSMTYCFGFKVPNQLQFLFHYYDLLPHPAGVAVNYVMNVVQTTGAAHGAATVHGVS